MYILDLPLTKVTVYYENSYITQDSKELVTTAPVFQKKIQEWIFSFQELPTLAAFNSFWVP